MSQNYHPNIRMTKAPEEDILEFSRILLFDIVQTRIAKLVLYFLTSFFSVVLVVQSWEFLINFNTEYFFQYSATYSHVCFFIMSCIGNLTLTQSLIKNFKRVPQWSVEMAGAEYRRQIEIYRTLLNLFTCGNLALSLFSSLLFCISDPDDSRIYFMQALAQKYFPSTWNHFVVFPLLRLIFVLCGYVSLLNINQITYFEVHGVIQVKLLEEVILRDLRGLKKCSYNDEQYHRNVEEVLRVVWSHYVAFTVFACEVLLDISYWFSFYCRPCNAIMRERKNYIAPYTICLICLSVTTGFFMYSFKGSIFATFVRNIFLLAAGGSSGLGLIITGQYIESITADLHAILYDVPWYDWNKKNKQIYRILLLTTFKEFRISFSQNVSINYQFAISVAKAIYSTINIYIQMRRKRGT